MAVQRVFAQILNGRVENISVSEDYEMANWVTKQCYGDDAIAVECTQYPCGIGDLWHDNTFYHVLEDGSEEEIPYVPTAEEQVRILTEQLETLETTYSIMNTAMTFAAVSFTDEQAYKVPTLYKDWTEYPVDYHFEPGLRLRYKDILYKVINNGHNKQDNWTPDTAVSEFTKVLNPDPEVIQDWEQPDSTNGYQYGDKVRHKDHVWVSMFEGSNVWEPGAVGTENLWKIVE